MYVLMVSGGIDSTVLMYWLVRQQKKVAAFFCDYGQASAKQQLEFVEYHTNRLHVPLHYEKIEWPEYAKGRGFIFNHGKYPAGMTDPYAPTRMNPREYSEYLDNEWDFIQGRNIIFLTRACAFAIANGWDRVCTAFQCDAPEWEAMKINGDGGGDATPAFLRAFNLLAESGGFSKPIKVLAPFLEMRLTKEQIVVMGRKLLVSMKKTYSCEFYPECRACHQCLIRASVLPE